MDKISVAGALTIIVLALIGLNILLNIPLERLATAPPGILLSNLSDITFYETMYLWRERIFDTIFQSFVLFAALSGILIYVLWRGGGR